MDIRYERQKLKLSQAKLSEISNIPQSILSSYELGKREILPKHLQILERVFVDSKTVSNIVSRKKRYSNHTYSQVRQNTRSSLCKQTKGNTEYTSLLNDLYCKHQDPNKKYTAISLFSGIGGLSLGFSSAQVSVKGFLEINEDLRNIYKQNFPDSIELGSDIKNVSDDQIRKFVSQIGQVDFIIGGPPCQGFSLSGKRDVSDPRNRLFKEYLRFVKIFNPKIVVIENVKVLTSMKNEDGKFVIDDIYKSIESIGYQPKHFEINAKDFGVPEHRERVIILAYRKDITEVPSFPAYTHGHLSTLFSELKEIRTFGDACSDLEYLESGEKSKSDKLHQAVKHPDHVIEWLWNVPEGKSAHDNEDERLRPPSGYNTTYKRQIWNEPASTVQTTFGMISGCRNVHPIATRSLTIREAARIQSFPDKFIFEGSQGAIRTGIGNAVPPLLAYVIAIHLIQVISKYDKSNQP